LAAYLNVEAYEYVIGLTSAMNSVCHAIIDILFQ